MTHDDLLIEINRRLDVAYYNGDPQSMQALRAVVELHKPVEFTYIEADKETMFIACDICYINKLAETHIYPCETIQAIEKELK